MLQDIDIGRKLEACETLTMQLAILLAEAHEASPDRRILWRDPIAAFGERAIEGVRPWLSDRVLAAFAIRVIARAGEQGESVDATRVLRAARSTMAPHLQADIDWALARVRAARGLASRIQSASPPPIPIDLPVRERLRFSTVARRRHR
jgi:hypothetical protein